MPALIRRILIIVTCSLLASCAKSLTLGPLNLDRVTPNNIDFQNKKYGYVAFTSTCVGFDTTGVIDYMQNDQRLNSLFRSILANSEGITCGPNETQYHLLKLPQGKTTFGSMRFPEYDEFVNFSKPKSFVVVPGRVTYIGHLNFKIIPGKNIRVTVPKRIIYFNSDLYKTELPVFLQKYKNISLDKIKKEIAVENNTIN